MARKRNKMLYIKASDLQVHPSAQRKLVPAQVKKVMSDLDLDAIGTFHVVYIDGKYWIIDGQHRWWALIRHGFGDWTIRCELHEDASDHARASALFLKLNDRTTIASFDRFANEVQAGDELAVVAKSICERHGLNVDRQAADGNIACVTTIKTVCAIDRGQTLDDTLAILIEAQGRTACAMEGKIISGLAIVLDRFNGEVDRPVLAKKLSKYPGGAAGLLGDAKGLKKIRKGSLSRCVAETIIEAYNSGRRDHNRLTLS